MPSVDHSFTHFKLRIYPRSMLADSKKLVISQDEQEMDAFQPSDGAWNSGAS